MWKYFIDEFLNLMVYGNLQVKLSSSKSISKMCEFAFDFESLTAARNNIIKLASSNSNVEKAAFLYLAQNFTYGFSKKYIQTFLWKPYLNLFTDKSPFIRKLFLISLGKFSKIFNIEDDEIFDIKNSCDKLLMDENIYVAEEAKKVQKEIEDNQSILIFNEIEDCERLCHENQIEEKANIENEKMKRNKYIPHLTNSSPNVREIQMDIIEDNKQELTRSENKNSEIMKSGKKINKPKKNPSKTMSS